MIEKVKGQNGEQRNRVVEIETHEQRRTAFTGSDQTATPSDHLFVKVNEERRCVSLLLFLFSFLTEMLFVPPRWWEGEILCRRRIHSRLSEPLRLLLLSRWRTSLFLLLFRFRCTWVQLSRHHGRRVYIYIYIYIRGKKGEKEKGKQRSCHCFWTCVRGACLPRDIIKT